MGSCNKKYTTEEFIEICKEKHNNFYDYLETVYVNSHTKIKVNCPIHGLFEIQACNHRQGQGCKLCGILRKSQCKPKTTEKFIEDAKKRHGDFLYSYTETIYLDTKTKVKIKCNRCNQVFEMKPNSHLNGQGCGKCNKNKHKSVLDYNGPNTKVCIKCNIEKNLKEFYIEISGRNRKYVYYRGECKECQRKQKIEYRKDPIHKEKNKIYHRSYNNNRRKTDPSYKLRRDIPSIIRRSIKKDYSGDSIWNYLPYKPLDLKQYLEKQFDENMSWENHGKYWHIDHIKPQSSLPFNDTSHPNFLECWSLNNLRPLKIEDNLRKSSYYNGINYRRRKYILTEIQK